MPQSSHAEHRVSLSVFDAVMIVAGLVVGIGIFRTPSVVAANADSAPAFVAVWIAGGAVTLIGLAVLPPVRCFCYFASG